MKQFLEKLSILSVTSIDHIVFNLKCSASYVWLYQGYSTGQVENS